MDNEIKVLHVINRLNVGGITSNVAFIAKYLPSRYNVKIVSGNIESDEASAAFLFDEMGLDFELIEDMHKKIAFSKDYKALNNLIKVINDFKPAIIHTHAAKAGALGRVAALLAKHQPEVIIHTYHGNVFDGYYSIIKSAFFIAIERILAKFTHAIVSVSNKQKIDFTNRYHIAKAKKIHVVPLGLDLNSFINISPKSGILLREEFSIQADKKLVVITGRLAPIKNHCFLIEVISLYKNKYGLNFTTLIVGDGELKESLMNLCSQLNLSYNNQRMLTGNEDIIFASWRKDIPEINQAADVCVLCSLNEGTPVSIIEAMASGKPVLTTRVGGVEDFITHEDNGMIAELDLEDFCNKLNKLIEDPDFCTKISKNARSSVIEKFDYRRLVSDIDHLYQNLLENKS